MMPEADELRVLCGLCSLLLVLGQLMYECGQVRSKNASSVFLRGLATLTLSLVTSWVAGFALAHSSGHYLIGHDYNYSTLYKVPQVESRARQSTTSFN